MTPPAWLCRFAADLGISVAFCTRLPLAQSAPTEGRDVARASWAMPVAGALVGGMAALVYWAGYRGGLPSWPAAALALAAAVAMTGVLHEDGLADTADGFGGGKDREHKLAIMRDSRLGTYGACALAASFMLRWSALASLADPLPVAIAPSPRTHRRALPCRPSCASFRPRAVTGCPRMPAGRRERVPPPRPSSARLRSSSALEQAARSSVVLPLALAGVGTAWLSMGQIGGQTGDVAGALEQAGEVLVLLAATVLLKT